MKKDVVNGMVIKEAKLKKDNAGREYAALTIEENRMKLLENGTLKRTGRIFHCVTAYGRAKEEILNCRKGEIVKLTGHHYLIRKCKNIAMAFNATTVKRTRYNCAGQEQLAA